LRISKNLSDEEYQSPFMGLSLVVLLYPINNFEPLSQQDVQRVAATHLI